MKTQEELSIVFMGTPEFAVTILERILQEEYTVKAVVTVPDKPAGRGRKMHASAVKLCAQAHNLPILQPARLKDAEFVETLQALNADLFIVVAFRMLPEIVWRLPKLGTFNLHGSLLPEYRGAAPINWAVINGDTETGVTTFFIDEKIDTGKMILQEKMTIGENETAGEVHDRMMVLGAETVVKTIELIREEKVQLQAQSEGNHRPAPKIFKPDCRISFDQPLANIHNHIRGLSPYPTAWCTIKHIASGESKSVKIFRTTLLDTLPHAKVSWVKNGRQLHLQLLDGTLQINEIQLEGKKRMDATAFLAGFHPEEWEIEA